MSKSPRLSPLRDAAPNLRKALIMALEEIRSTLESLIEHGDGVDFVRDDIRRLKRIVKAGDAAIAKSKGEAQ